MASSFECVWACGHSHTPQPVQSGGVYRKSGGVYRKSGGVYRKSGGVYKLECGHNPLCVCVNVTMRISRTTFKQTDRQRCLGL